MGSVLGGSKQKSSSSNQAYGTLSEALTPVLGNAQTGANALSALLSGDTSGFDAFKGATGFDAAMGQGLEGITGSQAAKGLLRSGSAGKAFQNFGQGLQNQYADSYMNKLLSLAGLGINAGNTLAGAGGTSTSSGKNKSGLGGLLGSAASGVAASDRRLKKDIKHLRTMKNGLKLYQYRYVDDSGPFVGVMADEVKAIMPEALGPTINGYNTVDYSKIGAM